MPDTNQQWIERQFGFGLTDRQARCLNVLCTLDRVYNLDRCLAGKEISDRWELLNNGGISIRYKHELSTYDGNNLTEMVLAAHKEQVRTTINARSGMSVLITTQPWRMDEGFHNGHKNLSWLTGRAEQLDG